MSKKNSHRVSGFEAITDKEVASILSRIAEIQGSVGQTTALSAAQRQSTPKIRRGAQQVMPTLAALATKHRLETPLLPISEISAQMEHAARLREVLGAVTVLQKLLTDTVMVTEGAAWQTATGAYAALRRAAKRQPTLAAELAPIIEWFRAPKRSAEPVTTPPET